jgi:hypothetical protein
MDASPLGESEKPLGVTASAVMLNSNSNMYANRFKVPFSSLSHVPFGA